MKALLLLALLPMCASAQNTVSVYGRVAPSSGGGSGTGYGLGTDIYSYLGDHFAVQADLSLEWEPKTYVGNGKSIRISGVGLIPVHRDFLVGGGLQVGRHWNDAYSKNQAIPLVAVHYNPSQKVDVYAEWLIKDLATFDAGRGNNLRGVRAGWKGVFPIRQKLGAYVRLEYGRFWYEQLPGYPNAGTHSGQVFLVGTGLSWRYKP